MAKTKKDYLDDLVKVAFAYDKKFEAQEQRVDDFQRMAYLARRGEKDSLEFRSLQSKHNSTVVDFGNEAREMKAVIKGLKKFKWNF